MSTYAQHLILKKTGMRWGGSFGLVSIIYFCLLFTAIHWQASIPPMSAQSRAAMRLDFAPMPAMENVTPAVVSSVVSSVVKPPQSKIRHAVPKQIPQEPPLLETLPVLPVEKGHVNKDKVENEKVENEKDKKDSAVLASRPIPVAQEITPSVTQGTVPQDNFVDASKASLARAPSFTHVEAMATWQADLLMHIERHKRYPQQARRRGMEAVIYVQVIIDREGRVVQHQLIEASQYKSLNREVLALITRAQPLPVPPAEFGDEVVEFVVPIRFSLKR